MAVHVFNEDGEVKFVFTGKEKPLEQKLNIQEENIQKEVNNEQASNVK